MLNQIARSVELQIEKLKRETSESELRERVKEDYLRSKSMIQLSEVFRVGRVNIIAEIKAASPSAGVFVNEVNPVQTAGEYLANRACALSILTEKEYFNGKLEYLKEVHSEFPRAFLLMKDFVIDPYQILLARLHGASAVLLIAALLGPVKLEKFHDQALELGIHPLVEVHDEDDLSLAQAVGAKFIGVNNRDLKTMSVSLKTSERLIDRVSPEAIVISESGITQADQIRKLIRLGYQGFLIGSHFMRSSSPGLALRALLQETEV